MLRHILETFAGNAQYYLWEDGSITLISHATSTFAQLVYAINQLPDEVKILLMG